MIRSLERGAWGVLARLDAAANRLYGWRFNPLYQSGALAVALLAVVTVTGVYLLFFYRIGAPYESVARISNQWWGGAWIRGLHRYASDAALVAVAVHAFRMFAQRRSWGPRTLAWVSGVVTVGLVLVCGWTGYVMVWDVQAQALAIEGARMLDALPIFTEPVSRTFAGEKAIPGQFFFLNLFAHIAIPIGIGVGLWLHVSRLARPVLMPPRPVWVGATVALLALAVAWPAALPPPADILTVPGRVPLDLFYNAWLPLTRGLPGWTALALVVGGAALVASVPWWPRRGAKAPPSEVDERLCTGCVQCSLDCPYEAITMIPRPGERSDLVARVDPARCTSCGICAGSCAPMGVGPAGRTGRDQLGEVREATPEGSLGPGDVVVVTCARGTGDVAEGERIAGARVHRVSCAGNLHSSSIEWFLRAGAGGVLVVPCPPRDCWNREGPRWTRARMFEDREAELRARVDRRRVGLVYAAAAEGERLEGEVRRFRARIETLDPAAVTEDAGDETVCEPPAEIPERVLER